MLYVITLLNGIAYVYDYYLQNSKQLDANYSERVQIPAKAFLSPTLGNTCHAYYFAAR